MVKIRVFSASSPCANFEETRRIDENADQCQPLGRFWTVADQQANDFHRSSAGIRAGGSRRRSTSLLRFAVARTLVALALASTVRSSPVAAANFDPANAGLDASWSYWAGHQVLHGKRRIPILGLLDTRLDTYYLAKIRVREGRIEVAQEACVSRYARFAGVSVSFPASALPDLNFTLAPLANQNYIGSTSVSWGEEDIDRDGQPGMSIDVDAAICGGTIYVGSDTRVTMELDTLTPTVISGRTHMHHTFEVHDASTFCLRAFSRNRSESAAGTITFVPLASPKSCTQLARGPWPRRQPSVE
jgi:hypothetical protein